MAIVMSDVNINLKAVRTNAGKTQKEWADLLNVTVDTVLNWEAGKSEPKWSQVKQMSELSGIPADCIFVPTKS